MTQPTHEQGQLQLEIYDLRREAKLRQARDWFFRNYFADTFDESMRIAPPGYRKRSPGDDGDQLLGTGLRVPEPWPFA
jgi:hypothetical protein